jgi:hypothetical protein
MIEKKEDALILIKPPVPWICDLRQLQRTWPWLALGTRPRGFETSWSWRVFEQYRPRVVKVRIVASSVMRFCDAGACSSCSLADLPDPAPCLRHKAHFCMWLSATVANDGLRAALEKMSLDLMDEASAVTKERALST